MRKCLSMLVSIAILFSNSIETGASDFVETKLNPEYIAYVEEICDEYYVCPELIEALIEAESNGDARAESKSGAIGLTQIIPKHNQDRMDELGVTDLYDPYSNILVCVDLITELFEEYEDIYTVLMCYNEGEFSGAVERADNGEWSDYAIKIVERSAELEELHGKLFY